MTPLEGHARRIVVTGVIYTLRAMALAALLIGWRSSIWGPFGPAVAIGKIVGCGFVLYLAWLIHRSELGARSRHG